MCLADIISVLLSAFSSRYDYIRSVRIDIIYALFLCAVSSVTLQAQIFADLEGEELFQATVEEYKPNFVETYSVARTLMYTQIYNVDDTVHTVYSGHKLFLPPDHNLPIQFLAMEASSNGINTEHIYPRSKGAKEEYGNAFSDLHNLAPARWAVNEARSNYPFSEVDDDRTDCWFSQNEKIRNLADLPAEMKDAFAEVDVANGFDGRFEPRESVKGDIARSVFYFYTMYRDEALREDENFFDEMREDLCSWHNTDGVDELEMDRNLMKAMVQDGKANPFVMDCSLVNRMYCPEFTTSSCDNLTTAIDETLVQGEELNPSIKIYPNPNNGIFTLDISSISPGNYQVDIYFLSGQLIYSLQERLDYFNSINMWNAKAGKHIIHLTNRDTGRKYSGLFTVVK